MRVRKPSTEHKVEQQMTAMIDVVFQLLTFFVMSFRVALSEGDFAIKMPLGTIWPAGPIEPMQTLKLQLLADVHGELSSIRLNSTPLPNANLPNANSWQTLRQQVMVIVGRASPENQLSEAEIEISCDARLKYAYVIDAITAVSSYPNGSGGTVKLIDKVKFAPPRKAG